MSVPDLSPVLLREDASRFRLQYFNPEGGSTTLSTWEGGDCPTPLEVEDIAEAHALPGRYRFVCYIGKKQGPSKSWTVRGEVNKEEVARVVAQARSEATIAEQMVAMARVNSDLVERIHAKDVDREIRLYDMNIKLLREMASLREQLAQRADSEDNWVSFANGLVETVADNPQLGVMLGAGAKVTLEKLSRMLRSPGRKEPPTPDSPPSPAPAELPANPDISS